MTDQRVEERRRRAVVVLMMVVVALIAVSFLPVPDVVVTALRVSSGLVTVAALVLALRR